MSAAKTQAHLDATASDLLKEWKLRVDGPVIGGPRTLVTPVRFEGRAAALKVSIPDDDNAREHLVLRHWAGHGAVQLLRAEPHRRALLLERVGPDDLTSVDDHTACQVVAGLFGRLHVPPQPQWPAVDPLVAQWSDDLAALPRSAPIPRRLVEQALTHAADLVTDGPADVTLHGNLHFSNVLTGDREPWLAIASSPLSGDPHYDVAPMLWNRWDEMGHQARQVIRHRLFVLTDTADLDEDRARAWTLLRSVHHALRLIHAGEQPDSPNLTRFVTVAKAVQD